MTWSPIGIEMETNSADHSRQLSAADGHIGIEPVSLEYSRSDMHPLPDSYLIR